MELYGKSTQDATESENLSMCENFKRENREIPSISDSTDGESERSAKATGHHADMHVDGKSDGPIVPTKRANKTGTPAAESVEERGSPEGNVNSSYSRRTQCRITRDIDGHHVRQVWSVCTLLSAMTQGRSRMR